MFTIGIFSTHIPYIAFIFFYAYFLIFGIETSAMNNAHELTLAPQCHDQIVVSTNNASAIHFYESLIKRIKSLSIQAYRPQPWQYASTNTSFLIKSDKFYTLKENLPPPMAV